MNVIVFASRKGGSGKSTLTAHLAAHVDKASRPCLLIDAEPSKREDVEAPIVIQAREGLAKLRVPVWSGQITNRTNFSLALAAGEGAREYAAESAAAAEIARLWAAISKSVQAIRGHHD